MQVNGKISGHGSNRPANAALDIDSKVFADIPREETECRARIYFGLTACSGAIQTDHNVNSDA